MAFSAKTEYGLVALIELASVHASGGVLQVAEIARRQAIPERYLEQMLSTLRRAGILRSLRGPRGGYQLARDPGTITVAEVVACLEGTARAERAGERSSPEFTVLARLGERIEERRRTLLESTHLDQLLEERDALATPLPMYFI